MLTRDPWILTHGLDEEADDVVVPQARGAVGDEGAADGGGAFGQVGCHHMEAVDLSRERGAPPPLNASSRVVAGHAALGRTPASRARINGTSRRLPPR